MLARKGDVGAGYKIDFEVPLASLIFLMDLVRAAPFLYRDKRARYDLQQTVAWSRAVTMRARTVDEESTMLL